MSGSPVDRLEVIEGDITRQSVDAIVTPLTRPCSAAEAWTVRSTGLPARGFSMNVAAWVGVRPEKRE